MRSAPGWFMGMVLTAAVLGGCHQTSLQKADDVCRAFCDCVETGALASEIQRCIDKDCLPQLPPVTDTCLACVYQHDQTCPDLYDLCTTSCLRNTTPQLGGM